jgi:TonB-dependent starch-binding outer membrane protein SusC
MEPNYMNRLRLAVLLLFTLMQVQVMAQDRTISGKVSAANDRMTLPGVSVTKKGTNSHTTTDGEGNFKISASDQDILVFSYIGFTNKEVPVSTAKNNILNIFLEEQTARLNEVVVVGYGTQSCFHKTRSFERYTYYQH